jgi:2,3-dihydroxy-p-cumate/2,3-dihydroxybenzoate 3,4-dioxygenase
MIRYKKLGYVALQVSDLDQSANFYENIVGLNAQPRKSKDEPVYLRCSRDHHNLILYPGKEAGLKRVAFELEDEKQLEIAFEHLTKNGLQPQELDKRETMALNQGKTFRFKDPYVGITFEMYSEMMQMGKPYVPKETNIERVGHVVIETNKFDELLKFLLDILNFKVSDVSGQEIGWAWLRAFPNPLHHSFALVRGKENKMNHMAFNVYDIDDVGRGMNRLKRNNIPILFGPGRHAPSGSIFLYFPDPDGLTLEFSQGMEKFPEEGARKPRRLEPSLETLDMWGGTPDPAFGKIGKIINE